MEIGISLSEYLVALGALIGVLAGLGIGIGIAIQLIRFIGRF